MPTINSVLKKLDLNEKEVHIYLALIQSGPSSVQNISRATSISRSTVYQRIENLRKAGLVVFEFGEKGQVVRAIHPDRLRELIEKRVADSKKLSDE
ncbi:MAG: helix-turn-helix domain-containing protein, partial [Candidatus Dojkabacteria bacterium]|nr:helix-turn-helix domain-containing protein [Candidatus Dojkabacteria bacterium]